MIHRFQRTSRAVGLLATLGILAASPSADRAVASDFSHKVAPVLAARCITCHASDAPKGGLRLDTGAGLLRGGDRGSALVPGSPDESLLFQVISGAHAELAMPPKGESVTAMEQDAIKSWIAAGALIPDTETETSVKSFHWAFQPVERPKVPEGQGNNPIDAFIRHTMAAAGVTPSPEADRPVLVRRLYLDLLGLPPEPDVIAAYLADTAPDAYEKLVDQLLASPHFGERWGRHWLDLARFADSDGYEKDSPRPYAWRYRDWVIHAINEDMPYDQFVTQQLAGDLLPGATLAQRTATGFHRNTLTNREGGIDPEEDRVKQAVDRTNTTGAVFMGLTVGCAQCHNHKYDPISQREYFSMYSFFDAALEENIPAPLPGEEEAYATARAQHEAALAAKQTERSAYREKLAADLPAWEAGLVVPDEGWSVLDPTSYSSLGGAMFNELDDLSLLLEGENPPVDTYTVVTHTDLQAVKAIRLEVLAHESMARSGPGRAVNGAFFLTEFSIFAAPADDPLKSTPVAIKSATSSFVQPDFPVETAFDGDSNTGWAIFDAKNINKDVHAEFTLAEPVGFANGTIFTIKLEHAFGKNRNIGRFRLAHTQNDPANIVYSDDVLAALHTPVEQRTPAQIDALLDRLGQEHPEYQQLNTALADLTNNPPKPIDSIVMAMAGNPSPPTTHIHVRGDFLQPGEEVLPQTPAIFHPLKPRGEHADRLDLARWIVDPANPLTARVAVNRVWEHLFGDGLVRTSEDYGTRTEPPTHPELLDWLAASFVEDHHWSTKSLIKAIVSSAAYRQSSYIREDLLEMDPTNRLIARQNRFRVEAEITRDLFLAASGLLVDDIGGPSIRPPLPEGVAALGYANSVKWAESEGEDKYRRGLYIFFQRTVAYPMLVAFDCPDSNETKLSRNRSNTPLQSLTLLNDPVFVEAAQALGQRLLALPAESEADRAREAFKICMGREPIDRELELLLALLAEQERIFATLPEEAKTLVGPYIPEGVAPEKAAAHMLLARSIMNLDEFLTRE